MQAEAGSSLVPVEPPPVHTYRGTMPEIPGSEVRASFQDGRLTGVVYTPTGVYGNHERAFTVANFLGVVIGVFRWKGNGPFRIVIRLRSAGIRSRARRGPHPVPPKCRWPLAFFPITSRHG